MRRYEFKVVIFEGSDEFWESIKGKSGCDEVKDLVLDALGSMGFEVGDDLEVELTSFTNHPN